LGGDNSGHQKLHWSLLWSHFLLTVVSKILVAQTFSGIGENNALNAHLIVQNQVKSNLFFCHWRYYGSFPLFFIKEHFKSNRASLDQIVTIGNKKIKKITDE
jgi:hypothetical protein